MKALAVVLLAPLAVAFLAGLVVGVGLLLALPLTRRAVAREAERLQAQAEAAAAWQAAVLAAPPYAPQPWQGQGQGMAS